MANAQADWPALPLEAWKDTYDTLHMYTQVVGKVRLEFAPMMNEWWQVPLYLTARGLTTSPIPYRDRTFAMTFDFFEHQLHVDTSDGEVRRIPLGGAVKTFYREVMDTLHALGIDATIWPHPVEVPDPIPFDQDDRHHTYDPDAARRFWDVLRQVAVVLTEFRARFTGKCSPVHFFWGSFDLAVTRFSGRSAAPKPDADLITRLAYDAQLSSVGFWPGGQGIDGAAFYSYTYPEPTGFRSQTVRPAAAFYQDQLGEFLLMYDDVRAAADPRRAILDFAQSTYEAGARLQNWPRELVSHGVEGGHVVASHDPSQRTSELAASKAPNPAPEQ
ncbi:MAG TPA: DUF5996 family protein [Gemmatimonadaceae bacterium]|nr:DUF5996 family protein [Gemmatimonadaceae bacterium]